MRWRPSRSSVRLTEGRVGSRTALAGVALLAAVAAGCAPAATRPAAPSVPQSERPFLRPPLEGWEGSAEPAVTAFVEELHRRLLAGEDRALVRREAVELAERRPELAPAAVVLAQLELVVGELESAAARLSPLVDGAPQYVAAAVALGHAAEGLGQVPRAYGAYRGAAPLSALAAERAELLRPRALEITGNRLSDALTRGQLEEADAQLAALRAWAPDETVTLVAEQSVAAARGDGRAELAAVRALRSRQPADPELRDRHVELEIEAGDPGEAIGILQQMQSERPDDPSVARRLARARFQWRLVLLPGEVRELLTAPELTRGELASLLYWLFPKVRYARPQRARIANDVFDHRFREEIVRVINLGLMDVDVQLHQFVPERPVTRVEAMAALLRLVAGDRPELGCLGGVGRSARVSWPMVCGAAAACGLLDSESDCLPSAGVAGREALEICRLAQGLLGTG